MKLRTHQRELIEIAHCILAGETINKIVMGVTPGGGKSAGPVLLADSLISQIADKLLWVCPRNALKFQGEEEFCSPVWQTPHRLRAVEGNTDHPSRGLAGYITTYQAIGQNPVPHWDEFTQYKYILFLDEPHHIAEDASWQRAIRPLIDNAVLTVFASGTLSRGDGKRIAFLDYDGATVDLAGDENTAVIQYTRSQAIREGAICPIRFKLVDGFAEWEETDGTAGSATLAASGNDSAKAVFTALRTDFAYHLLSEAATAWAHYQSSQLPEARLLVVAPNIELAKLYMAFMQSQFPHYRGEIATSESQAAARQAIDEYKAGVLDYLVTVAMAYEGLSVNPITHIACLTHIRSVPWLEQCFGRGNRLFPGKSEAWVYCPADPEFQEAIRMIEEEQLVPLSEESDRLNSTDWEPGINGSGGAAKPWINPLRSEAWIIDDTAPLYAPTIRISDQEKTLRKLIRDRREHHLNRRRNGARKSFTTVYNAMIRQVVDKSLDHMSLEELVQVDQMLRERFPV